MKQSSYIFSLLLTVCCLLAFPVAATDTDLMGLDLEGVRLGMSLNEAVTALENRDWKRVRPRSLEKRDAKGMHYVGLKVNPGGEVISVEVANHVVEGFDADALRDAWIERWGAPDSKIGNPGNDWNLKYDTDTAVLETWATKSSFPRRPSQVSVRLASKGQVLASRRGHEVQNKMCLAVKDKPVSLLNINDRDILLECLRTGQLRLVAP